MPKFMLLMRGNQDYFDKLSDSEKQIVIKKHVDYSNALSKNNLFIDGDGFDSNSKLIRKDKKKLGVIDSPFKNSSQQLSGFYIIEAKNYDEAIDIAKKCPAFEYGETIEVIQLGH